MGLISDKDIQSVVLNLYKNKPREREFRQYLDDQVKYGIDRKETILRMWEFISNQDSITNPVVPAPVVAEKEKEDKPVQCKILKMDELNNDVDEADWNSI